MIILGIDPGTAITGYGFIEKKGNKLSVLKYGVLRTKSSMFLAERLQVIFRSLKELMENYSPDEMAVEQLFFNTNAKTALSVGHARGVIILAAMETGVKVNEYSPLQVKQGVVGYGRAEKVQVQKMVCSLLNLESLPQPDDAADALAIAICHANSYNINKILANR